MTKLFTSKSNLHAYLASVGSRVSDFRRNPTKRREIAGVNNQMCHMPVSVVEVSDGEMGMGRKEAGRKTN